MAVSATSYEANAILLLGLALLSCSAAGATYGRRGLVDTTASTVFDVTNYGAKPDGKTDNSMSFAKAFRAACDSTEPVTVVIPKGDFLTGPTVFQGPCKGSEPIVFEVEGNVLASTDISEYSEPEWILFEYIDGMVVRGGGTFDGQGAASWKFNNCKSSSSWQLPPFSLKLHRVNNSLIENINSLNSKSFHMFLAYCENVTIQNMNITAPGDSPNTDGIHLSGSNLINITNTIIGTGDDCISIGQGTTNVVISGVVCGPGHGLSVGSLGKYPDEEDVKGIVVQNCTLSNTTNGVRIKTWPGSKPSQASDIHFEDVTMIDVKNPIIIDQSYGSKKTEPSRVKISDVHYKNIKGTSVSINPIKLLCSTAVPCEGIEMADIDLSYNGDTSKKGLLFESDCSNAKVVSGGTMNPPGCPKI